MRRVYPLQNPPRHAYTPTHTYTEVVFFRTLSYDPNFWSFSLSRSPNFSSSGLHFQGDIALVGKALAIHKFLN